MFSRSNLFFASDLILFLPPFFEQSHNRALSTQSLSASHIAQEPSWRFTAHSFLRPGIPEELSIKPRQPKGIGLFPNSLHKRSRAVNRFVKNGKANFGSPIEGNPKYSGQKKPKWIFHLTSTEISGIYTSGLHGLVHCSTASEAVEIFQSSLSLFLPIRQIL